MQLLGSQCNDIDIALENMMGVPFAERFVEFCRSRKNVEAKDVAKIESNPDQSKHLETARTTILGIELDFVNLRSEEYAENSRIPSQVVSHAVVLCMCLPCVHIECPRHLVRPTKMLFDETLQSTPCSTTYTPDLSRITLAK